MSHKNNKMIKTFRFSAAVMLLIFSALSIEAVDISSDLKSQSVEVNGTKINYKTIGSGPVLLLLHGYTLTGNEWDIFIEEFAKDHTLIIPDLPDHGQSDLLRGEVSLKKIAGIMAAFLKELNIEQFDAVGHSAGAMTLLNMIQYYDVELRSLVLIGAGLKFSKEGIEFTKTDTFENLSPELKEYYRSIHPGGDEQTKHIYDKMMGLLKSYDDFRLDTGKLRRTETKTLIVLGDRDLYFPVEHGIEMFRIFPDSQLWIVPGSGHAPVWEYLSGSQEAQSIFTEVVKRFWEENIVDNDLVKE